MGTWTKLFVLFVIGLVEAESVNETSPSACQYTFCWKKIGEFKVKHPAFLKLAPFQLSGASPSQSLFITSFTGNPFDHGRLYFVENIPSIAKGNAWSSIKPKEYADTFEWPNFVGVAPPEIFGANQMTVCDGFLVPGKSNGGVYVAGAAQGYFQPKKALSDNKQGYFYHNVTWIDLNGDGKLDILTARAHVDLFGNAKGELLWLENKGASSTPWPEHVITEGPDVLVTVLNQVSDSNKYLMVVATEFFSEKLMIYYLNKADLSVAHSQVLDDSIGKVYMSRWLDLNSDGVNELLVNNHEDKVDKSAIYVYSAPDVITPDAPWTKKKIASGFTIHEKGQNQGTPGFVYPFFPKVDHPASALPYMLVAGDGSQEAYVLRPTDAAFTYTMETIVKVNGVIGAIEIGDVDGDGYVEFFVPDYDDSNMLVYSFAP